MRHFNAQSLKSLLPRAANAEVVDTCFQTLRSAYEQPARHYHAAWHIDDCLGLLETHRSLARDARALGLAIFFHDLVCEPGARDNESASAEAAAAWLARCGEAPETIDLVRSSILATTRHELEPGAPEDCALLLDIDLASLASPPEVFDRNTELIRREFDRIDPTVVTEGRIKFLESFLARDHIYQTEAFGSLYETKARANLRRSLERLRSPLSDDATGVP